MMKKMLSSQNPAEIIAQVRCWKDKGETVAFVPTMGNLHLGHITLVKEALKRADHVVASIFVNAMQFSKNEDLATYPKTLAADKAALAQAGTALLFTPSAELIYPQGVASHTFVEVPSISDDLCGSTRRGHFRGVTTIVCKLLNIIRPDIALFGKKDFQQLLIIKTMVEDLSIPVEIIGVDTVREPSGLAMSSRNGYLNDEQKITAALLKQIIDAMADAICQGQELTTVVDDAKQRLIQAGFKPDYLAVRNAHNLQPVTSEDQHLVILAAAFLGKTRLIDNLTFRTTNF